MKNTRFASVLLLIAVILSVLVSCGSKNEAANETAVTSGDTIAETEVTTSIYDDLPTGDYGGYNFRILNNWSNFAYTSFGEEGLTGEVLDDAIYERNTVVAELLNITFEIQQLRWDDNDTALKKSVLANDDAYDIYFNEGSYEAVHAQNGYVVDMKGIKSLNPDAPWWNQVATESIRIGSPLYYLYGDLHLMYYECYCGMLMNTTACESVGLEIPYEIVSGGGWTIDRAAEYVKSGYLDLNGDSAVTADDQFGIGMHHHNAISFITGADLEIVERDANNLPVWNGLDDRFVTRYTTVAEKIFGDKNLVCNGDTKGIGSLDRTVNTMFGLGRLIFFVEPLGALGLYRDCEFEIGIIPVPKYDEAQDEYYSYIYRGAPAMGIPVTNTDLERTGVVAENLCAHSLKMVRQTYFDVTLDFKRIQDKESQEMLDIIFANGKASLANVYGWANFAGDMSTRIGKGSTDIASFAASRENKLVAAIQATIDCFAGQ